MFSHCIICDFTLSSCLHCVACSHTILFMKYFCKKNKINTLFSKLNVFLALIKGLAFIFSVLQL